MTATRPVGIAEEKAKMKLDIIDGGSIQIKPRMFILKEKTNLLDALDARINQYVQLGISREQIVVLTMKTMESSLVSPADYRLSRKNVLSAVREEGKILFTTVRKFKGLEAEVIICIDVNADTFLSERRRNAFYVGSSRAKLFLEVLSVLPTDEDIIALANTFSETITHNRMRALAMIANGLKVKIETDIKKEI